MKFKILLYLFFLAPAVLAQEYPINPEDIYRSPTRRILNMFSITVTTGYNSTKYSHDLSGFYYLQNAEQQFVTPNTGEPLGTEFDVYENWFNDPALSQAVVLTDTFDVPFPPIPDPVYNPLLIRDLQIFNADSLGLAFEGKSWGIPINVNVRYNYQKFRIGLGLGFEFHTVKSLSPNISDMGIRHYEPNFSKAIFFNYYLNLGYRFYDFWDYSFAAELELGKNKLGKKFNSGLINQGMYVNFGVSIEKNLSEYFRIIVKPSYDFKNFTASIPQTGLGIQHKNPAFKINFGVSITIPEIPRSPMKSDHVQLKHLYTDPETGRVMEVRGQPIWKRQNPKVGENHRKLWRYKSRNKKKLNPY